MAGEAYPDVPLYRHKWTALTGEAMRAQRRTGPSKSPLLRW
jgi:hypothetical protein